MGSMATSEMDNVSLSLASAELNQFDVISAVDVSTGRALDSAFIAPPYWDERYFKMFPRAQRSLKGKMRV
jgi:hypothetical protein